MGYITEMSQIYEEKKLTYLNFFKNELINKPKMDKKNSQTANLSLLRHKLSFFFFSFFKLSNFRRERSQVKHKKVTSY